VKFRPAGSMMTVYEAMERCVDIEDRIALHQHLHKEYASFFGRFRNDVEVELYDSRPDDRIGWPCTYIVTIDGRAVGFMDGPV
jgi:hypothetical protein